MTSLRRLLSTINMATLPLKASRKEQRFRYSFSLGKRRCPNTIHSEMRPVYGDKCFTRQRYMFIVRNLLVDEKVSLMKKDLADVLTTDTAIAAVASLTRSDRLVSISVQINLDNMLKNKRLTFDIKKVSLLNAFIFLVVVTCNGV